MLEREGSTLEREGFSRASNMYFLIGADGKVNGPLTAADIHQWLAEGRASKYSRVRRDREEAWQPLGSISELLPAAPPAPEAVLTAAPSAEAPRSIDALVALVQERAVTLDAGRCVSRAWALVRDNPVMLILSTIVAWALILGIAF